MKYTTKWEYETTAFPELAGYHSLLDYIADMHERLSEMGDDGWELVTVIYDTAVFKRPVVEKKHWIEMVNIVKEGCNCPVCSECRNA